MIQKKPSINWTRCHELARKIYLIDFVIDISNVKEVWQRAEKNQQSMYLELKGCLIDLHPGEEFDTWVTERNIKTLQEVADDNDEVMKVVNALAIEYNIEADLIVTEVTE